MAQMGHSVIAIIITKEGVAMQFAVTLAYLLLTNTTSDGLDELAEQTRDFNLRALVHTQECKCDFCQVFLAANGRPQTRIV